MSEGYAREIFSVETEDHWQLCVERYRVDAPKGIIVLAHAMFCNARTMDYRGNGVASACANYGFEVWNLDFRGHGASGPHAATGATWTYDDIVQFDVPAVAAAARKAVSNGPLIWIGHSLGAHAVIAAMSVAPELPIDRIVSLAGGVWISQLEPSVKRWLQKVAIFESWLMVTALAGYCPTKRVGFGSEDEAEPYVRQLVLNGRRNAWLSVGGDIDYLHQMGRVRAPVLSIVGEADGLMCHPVAAREWLLHLRNAQVYHRVVGSRARDPRGIDHMGLVTCSEMSEVWSELLDWSLTGRKI